MEEPLKISNSLLLKLVSRWSIQTKSFRIKEHLVPFNLFDVCVVLGLGVSGEVSFDNCTTGLVNHLFGEEEITIEKIVVKLGEGDNVHNYCSVYILLIFLIFHFPRTSRIVSIFPFSLLDNLESLVELG